MLNLIMMDIQISYKYIKYNYNISVTKTFVKGYRVVFRNINNLDFN